jgi:hypothetical protein
MMAHDDAQTLLAAVALDACESDEARAVRAHASRCRACGTELDRLGRAANLLAFLPAPPA